jgi:hypothetical protein
LVNHQAVAVLVLAKECLDLLQAMPLLVQAQTQVVHALVVQREQELVQVLVQELEALAYLMEPLLLVQYSTCAAYSVKYKY